MSKPKHTQATQPARHPINVLGQVLKLIPRSIISAAARETGVDTRARTFSVLSHLGTMIFAQLAHALSLNDICDWLRLKTRAIGAFGLTPPSRNNLSHANKDVIHQLKRDLAKCRLSRADGGYLLMDGHEGGFLAGKKTGGEK